MKKKKKRRKNGALRVLPILLILLLAGGAVGVVLLGKLYSQNSDRRARAALLEHNQKLLGQVTQEVPELIMEEAADRNEEARGPSLYYQIKLPLDLDWI